jgi:GH15 family glucan-1,4-alpha-glucosidase
VVETTFTTDTGTARLVDAMAFAERQRGPDLGLDAPHGIGGEHDLSERELPICGAGVTLARPGSEMGAWDQVQLDVYGELLNSLFVYRQQLGDLHPEIQSFAADLADTAARRWWEADSGMWEMRDAPRHHLSSKVLCWAALDRAVKLAPQLGEHAKAEEWEAARDEIRDAVLERGWSEERQAYAQSFDSDELDAAQLLMPILGSCRLRTSECGRRSRRSPAISPRTGWYCATEMRRV